MVKGAPPVSTKPFVKVLQFTMVTGEPVGKSLEISIKLLRQGKRFTMVTGEPVGKSLEISIKLLRHGKLVGAEYISWECKQS